MWHRRVKQRRETHKKGNTQRKALKLKFLLLIIQVWKPSNRESGRERPTHDHTCEDNKADAEVRAELGKDTQGSSFAQLVEVLPREQTSKTLMWEPPPLSPLTFEQAPRSAREGGRGTI